MAAAPDTVHTTDFAFSIEGVSQGLHVARLEGTEGISELFQFHVTLAVEDATSALRGVAGRAAKLTLTGGGHPRQIHGVVSRFRQGASGHRHAVYHATLVPKVFKLLHRQDARIFQEKSTPEIIEAVFQEAGITSDDYQLSLTGSYSPRDYCVQYRESDWAFVSRLMEEEGIFYFFETTDSGTKLVLGDASSAHGDIDAPTTVPFRAPGGGLRAVEAILRLEAVEEIHPGKVTLRDYNFEKPSLSLESQASGTTYDDLEVFEWPGGYLAPADGDRVAKLRVEERQAAVSTLDGEASCMRLAAGHRFTLDGYPIDELDGAYVLTSLFHEGSQPTMGETPGQGKHAYHVRFSAIADGVPFRPPRLTPKPTVHIQTAIVVGPDGTEIHTDEHGRVKVQFHWDRRGENNEKSSTWLRVSQAWAGAGWGAVQLPRVGQEVVVDFLDGDVDRPIVVGRVYHGTNVPPYALPGEKTKSTIKSMSSPDGEAGNELRFEDKKDSEEVFLHAQKDLKIAVENDKAQTVGNDETLDVTNNRSLTVGADAKLDVTGNRTITVGGDESLTIEGKSETAVTGTLSQTVSDDATVELQKNYSLTVGQSMTIEVTQDVSESITGKKTIEVNGEKLEITCGASKVKVSQSGVEIEATEIKIKGTASAKIEAVQIDLKSSGPLSIKADAMVKVEASGMVQVKGAMVKVN